MGKEQGEETMREGENVMEEQGTESGSWLKWVVVGLVVLAIAAGASWWGYQRYMQKQRKAEAQRLYEKHQEVKKDEDYRPGYASESVVQRLEKALKKDTSRTDIRMELFSIYDNRRGHIADESNRMKELIAEGLKAEVPVEEKVKLMKVAASYYPSVLGASSPEEARAKIVEKYPYTDYGVEVRLGKASSKAKRTREDALSYLEKTREIVKKHAKKKDYDPEKKLLYLDYLEGVYWKKKGEKEKYHKILYKMLSEKDFQAIRLTKNEIINFWDIYPYLKKKDKWKTIRDYLIRETKDHPKASLFPAENTHLISPTLRRAWEEIPEKYIEQLKEGDESQ